MDFSRMSVTTGLPVPFLEKGCKNLPDATLETMGSHYQEEFIREDHEHLRATMGDDYSYEMIEVARACL